MGKGWQVAWQADLKSSWKRASSISLGRNATYSFASSGAGGAPPPPPTAPPRSRSLFGGSDRTRTTMLRPSTCQPARRTVTRQPVRIRWHLLSSHSCTTR